MAKRTALVTGASSGIGREIARVLAREGFELVIVARRREELEKLAEEVGGAKVFPGDLTHREVPDAIFEFCQKEKITVDVLVNNAGFGTNGRFHEIDLQRELHEIQVNVSALVHLSKLFLPGMVERKKGHILNVGSTAGFQPGPFMAVYYATKAFVNSFSEALASEYAGTGVTVSVLCPGPTESGFVAAAEMHGTNLFKAMAVADSKSVAEAGVKGMLAGKAVIVPGLMNKVAIQANRVTPRVVVRTVTKRMNSRK